ncbi:MAG: SIR2 family NAD-dependent protein deacylase [Gemmatimonadaceae bacterium]
MTASADIARAHSLLAAAERVLVLTGAGVSAESGVPTFRGAGGLWRDYRAEELATPGAFARDARLVWEWYGWRRAKVAECTPNAAHLALARFALARPGRVRLVTQNVDELHADAARQVAAELGADPAPAIPLELHGSIFRARCTRCGTRAVSRDAIDASSRETLPRCATCGGPMRPDVVWFGESLDERVLGEAFGLAAAASACLVVGTSAVVQPAASLASVTARAGGAVIEINPEETPLTPYADVSIRSGAVAAVPEILG